MIHRSFAVAATLVLASAPAWSQTPIERLAPENTVFMVGTKNFQAGKERFQRTGLWTLMQSDQVQKIWADMSKDMTGGFEKMFEELGVDNDALVPPAGPVGFALFTTRDPELDTPKIAFLMTADYGNEENAGKTDSIMQAAMTRGEEEGKIEFEHKEVNGRKVYTIDLAKMKAEEVDGFDDIDMGGMPLPMPTPDEIMQGLDKLHYVRDGNTLMMCSDLDSLTEALDQAAGKAGGAIRAADRTEYQAVMSKIGEADAYGVLLTRDIMQLLAANDPMGMAEMIRPTLRVLVGEVQGYGFGMRFDSPTAMVEQTIAAYMPNGKQGLTSLMDVPVQKGAAPAFVGPDALSFSSFSFRFAGLMDVIRKVVNSNPMLAMQVGPNLDEMAPIVEQIAAAMGSKVHMITSSSRPFTAENRHSMLAIEVTKPEEFENMLAPMAAQTGIEARDFLGQRIYTLPEGAAEMMMPMPGMAMESFSLGIGGGYLLLGATPNVEQGLRATSQPGGASITTNTEFQRAIAALSSEGVIAWGFSDTIAALESTISMQRKAMEDAIKQMNEDAQEWGEEEFFKEMQAEAEAQLRESMKMWNMLDFNLLRRHIGPAAWQVQSVEDGFVMKAYQMSAGAN